MTKIDIEQIKKLRDETGAAMMDAKKALEKAGGDLDKAVEALRKAGQLKAEKKSDRSTGQGVIDSYIHDDGRIGVLLEVNSETDFVARNEDFKSLVHDLALHIAAANPLYVSREDVPEETKEKEKEIFREQAHGEDKPADVVDKIVQGKLEKYYEETCLLEQPFVKDQDKTVEDLITEKISVLGENIQVGRFTRYVLGQ